MPVGRFETQEYVVTIAGRTLRILGPRDPHALHYDPQAQARWEQYGYKPYWAQPWPAAVMLAEHVLTQLAADPDSQPILELGAGLGIVGLALTQAGYRVVITDYDEDALAFVRGSAILNDLAVYAVRLLDWRAPPEDCYRTIVAAEVLYSRMHHQPLATLLKTRLKPGGVAWLSDTNREEAEPFPALVRGLGLACEAVPTTANAIPAHDARDGRVFDGRVFRVVKPGA